MSGGNGDGRGSHGEGPGSHSRFSAKDLSMLNVAIAAAQNRSELQQEIDHAARNGVTDAELFEILDEVARFTGGEPTCVAPPRVPPEGS